MEKRSSNLKWFRKRSFWLIPIWFVSSVFSGYYPIPTARAEDYYDDSATDYYSDDSYYDDYYSADDDGDGISNYEEESVGFEINVSYFIADEYGTDEFEGQMGYWFEETTHIFTDPLKKDTDDDLIPDDVELAFGLNPVDAADGNADDDEDLLTYGAELLLGTSPTNPDSDGGGVFDGVEYFFLQTDPLNNQDDQPDNDDADNGSGGPSQSGDADSNHEGSGTESNPDGSSGATDDSGTGDDTSGSTNGGDDSVSDSASPRSLEFEYKHVGRIRSLSGGTPPPVNSGGGEEVYTSKTTDPEEKEQFLLDGWQLIETEEYVVETGEIAEEIWLMERYITDESTEYSYSYVETAEFSSAGGHTLESLIEQGWEHFSTREGDPETETVIEWTFEYREEGHAGDGEGDGGDYTLSKTGEQTPEIIVPADEIFEGDLFQGSVSNELRFDSRPSPLAPFTESIPGDSSNEKESVVIKDGVARAEVDEQEFPQTTASQLWVEINQPVDVSFSRTYFVAETNYDGETKHGTITLTVPPGELQSTEGTINGDLDTVKISNGVITVEIPGVESGGGREASTTVEHFDFSFVPINEDGSERPSMGVPRVSTISPSLTSTVSVSTATLNSDGSMTASVSVSGETSSPTCDIIQGDEGKITDGWIRINGSGPSIEEYGHPLNISGDKTEGSGILRYPFLGNFDTTTAETEITEGYNTIDVEVADPVTGMTSSQTFGFNVEVIELPPPGTSSLAHTLSSLAVEVGAEGLQETVSGTVYVKTVQNGNSQTVELSETEPDSLIFTNETEDLQLQIASGTDVTVPYQTILSTLSSPDSFGITLPVDQNLDGEHHRGSLTFAGVNRDGESSASDGAEIDPAPQRVMSMSKPELVDHKSGGDSYFYKIKIEGLKKAASGLEKISLVIHSQSFDAKLDEDTGEWVVLDPNAEEDASLIDKVMVYMLSPSRTADTVDWVNGKKDETTKFLKELCANLPREIAFEVGLSYGFAEGGFDIISTLGIGGKIQEELVNIVRDGVAVIGLQASLEVFDHLGEKESIGRVQVQFEHAHTLLHERLKADADFFTSKGKFLYDLFTVEDSYARLVLMGIIPEDDPTLSPIARQSASDAATNMILSQIFKTLTDEGLQPFNQGRVVGLVVFEVALGISTLGVGTAVSGGTKIVRAGGKISDGLSNLLKSSKIPTISPEVMTKIRAVVNAIIDRFKKTKMCFVAGTPVITARGYVPIELVGPGDLVVARDEEKGRQELRPVVQTFETHPTELFHLGFDTDGDGQEDEVISSTGEHPFFVLNQKTGQGGEFRAVKELKVGNFISDIQRSAVQVVSIRHERAPPGAGTFTTYNFEVEDFHTYFVGESGVWVHNTGKSPCDEVFIAFYALTDKASAPFHGKPWGAFDDVARTMGKDRNSSIFGWAADEVMRKQLKDLPLSQRVAEWPSHTQVKATMSRVKGARSEVDLGGTTFGEIAVPDWVKQERVDLGSVKSFTLESHHGVPKKVQDWLGLTKDKDSVPAYLTTMLEHRGAGVGIHQKLAQKMGDKIGSGPVNLNQAKPAALTEDLIKEALQETYEEFGLGHFWEVCEHWIGTP